MSNQTQAEKSVAYKKEVDLIKKLNLSENDVLKIVKSWYLNGMYPYVLQDFLGQDLEEIIDNQLEH